MKTILIIILAFVFAVNFGFAKNADYKLTAANIKYTSPNSLEFDIYLLNTNPKQEELKYSLGQYFLEFNPKIANGGDLIYSIIASDLPENMRPRNPSVADNLLRLAMNSVSSDKGNLPLVPTQKQGLLVAKMKLETTAKKFDDTEKLDLKWTDEKNKMKTKFAAFIGKKTIEITNAENHISESGALAEADNSGNITEEYTEVIPAEYSISQNFPNPFNPTTNIKFDIPVNASDVKLIVYDLTGRTVATLVNESLNAGRYEVTFNGADLSSGMYFYKITAGSFSVVRKMILIK